MNDRTACLNGHPCEPETHREALFCATHHVPSKPFARVAEAVSYPANTLKNMVNPNLEDWPAMRKLVGLLDVTAERPTLARFYARQQGGLFVPMPQLQGDAHTELFASATEVMTQLTEAMQQIKTRLGDDGRITTDEVPAVHRDILDIVTSAIALDETVKRLAVKRAPVTHVPRAAGVGR